MQTKWNTNNITIDNITVQPSIEMKFGETFP